MSYLPLLKEKGQRAMSSKLLRTDDCCTFTLISFNFSWYSGPDALRKGEGEEDSPQDSRFSQGCIDVLR